MKSIVFKNIKDMTLRPNPDWKFFLVLIFYRQSIWLLKRAKLINTLSMRVFLCFSSREQIMCLELVNRFYLPSEWHASFKVFGGCGQKLQFGCSSNNLCFSISGI